MVMIFHSACANCLYNIWKLNIWRCTWEMLRPGHDDEVYKTLDHICRTRRLATPLPFWKVFPFRCLPLWTCLASWRRKMWLEKRSEWIGVGDLEMVMGMGMGYMECIALDFSATCKCKFYLSQRSRYTCRHSHSTAMPFVKGAPHPKCLASDIGVRTRTWSGTWKHFRLGLGFGCGAVVSVP